MKLFKDGSMYVETSDIVFIGVVPRDVGDELVDDSLSRDGLVEFTGKSAISFWKGKKEILDYNSLKKLSDQQISSKILEYTKEINKLSERAMAQSKDFRRIWEKENDFNNRKKNMEHIRKTLQNYLENRERYDVLFKV